MLSDAQIQRMPPDQRQELIARLSKPLTGEEPAVPLPVVHDRRTRTMLLLAMALGLVPWTAYLAVSLPSHYRAVNWDITWAGFDVALVVMLALSSYLGWHRRLLTIPVTFAAGLLLVTDAWFDAMTARDSDVVLSLLSAAVLELPVGSLLIYTGVRLLRRLATRLWLIDAGQGVWQATLPLRDEVAVPSER